MKLTVIATTTINGERRVAGSSFEAVDADLIRSLLESGICIPSEPETRQQWRDQQPKRPRWARNWQRW